MIQPSAPIVKFNPYSVLNWWSWFQGIKLPELCISSSNNITRRTEICWRCDLRWSNELFTKKKWFSSHHYLSVPTCTLWTSVTQILYFMFMSCGNYTEWLNNHRPVTLYYDDELGIVDLFNFQTFVQMPSLYFAIVDETTDDDKNG